MELHTIATDRRLSPNYLRTGLFCGSIPAAGSDGVMGAGGPAGELQEDPEFGLLEGRGYVGDGRKANFR